MGNISGRAVLGTHYLLPSKVGVAEIVFDIGSCVFGNSQGLRERRCDEEEGAL